MDLSRPEDQCIKSLEQWLLRVASFSKTHHDAAGTGTAAKDSLLHYLQYAKHSKTIPDSSSTPVSNTASSQSSSSDTSTLRINVGFPIIVVGCKADVIGSQGEAGAISSAKELQGRLRGLCLQFGAGLVYTSVNKMTNVVSLRKYMYHRLYPEVIPNNLVIEVYKDEFLFYNQGR